MKATINKLSTIQYSNSNLYNLADKCSKAIASLHAATGVPAKEAEAQVNLQVIFTIIEDEANNKGDLYKYYFDEQGVTQGNNLLLDAIAAACHTPNKEYAKFLFQIIMADAEKKLSFEEMEAFVSFRYSGNKDAYFFDNTPLTLAIKCGLIDEAKILIEKGANVHQASELYGGFTPLHLAIARIPYSSNKAQEKGLVKLLIQKGANIQAEDNFHKTPLGYVMEKAGGLHLEDAPYFGLNSNFMKEHGIKAANLSLTQLLEIPAVRNCLSKANFDFKLAERHDLQAFKYAKTFLDNFKLPNEQKLVYSWGDITEVNEETKFLDKLLRQLDYDFELSDSLKSLKFVVFDSKNNEFSDIRYYAEEYFTQEADGILDILGLN
ncbi:MAG: ankyrin repeat protein [Rickettsiaceae bacterium]|jgi:hypothetical protein|nr:ankyrin repeat protein [Rickettsiaceae bacterium]